MGKALIIYEQDQILKDACERLENEHENEKKEHNEIEAKYMPIAKALWGIIEARLNELKLIEKDEDGDYPSLAIDKETGVIELSSDKPSLTDMLKRVASKLR